MGRSGAGSWVESCVIGKGGNKLSAVKWGYRARRWKEGKKNRQFRMKEGRNRKDASEK